MKFSKLFFGVTFLIAFSHHALAELKLIKHVVIPFGESEPQMKLISENEREYLIKTIVATSLRKTKFSYLEIEDFFYDRSSWRIPLNDSPLFPALGTQRGLLAVANGKAEWSAIKLNKVLTKVEKYGELKSMLLVSETAKVGDKHIVGGVSKDNKPIVVKMSDNLKLRRELKLPSNGRVNSVFELTGEAYVIADFEATLSEVLKLSPELSVSKKYKLAGALATGIPLRDGGFAVTYTSLPSKDVFVERFDASGQPLWKQKLFTRSGISTEVYVLCELQDGLGLVGGNNRRLLVVRIDTNGQHVRITEDTGSGLNAPSGFNKYLVGVLGNNIHIRGMARNLDGSSTSFHFIEAPAP